MSEATDGDARLHEEVAKLRKRITHLENAVEELRGGESGGRGTSTDPRDAAVLERLDPPEKVGRGKLEQLYRAETDVRNKNTLKGRIKNLTAREDFENASPGVWIYWGDVDE